MRIIPQVLVLVLAVALINLPAAADDIAHVQVRQSKLRSAPKFFASSVSGVRYGDKLTVLGQEGAWWHVRSASGRIGYVHSSAVSERPVEVEAASSAVGTKASKSDVVMAGKGFDKMTEREYRKANPEAKFAEVDRMERRGASPAEIASFMKAGQLNTEG